MGMDDLNEALEKQAKKSLMTSSSSEELQERGDKWGWTT